MMTQQELHDELWMLTMSILQDSRMDTKEAQILKRWFEENQRGNEFSLELDKLNRFLLIRLSEYSLRTGTGYNILTKCISDRFVG